MATKTDKLNLAAPQQMGPAAASFEIIAIHKRRAPWALHIELRDDQGKTYDRNYAGAQARGVIRQLNTADLSVRSEERRLLEWLQSIGDLGAGGFVQVDDEPAAPAVPAGGPKALAAPGEEAEGVEAEA